VNFKIYSIIPKKTPKWGKLKLLHIVKYLLAALIPILLLASPFLSTLHDTDTKKLMELDVVDGNKYNNMRGLSQLMES
jgi:hypothetical protein